MPHQTPGAPSIISVDERQTDLAGSRHTMQFGFVDVSASARHPSTTDWKLGRLITFGKTCIHMWSGIYAVGMWLVLDAKHKPSCCSALTVFPSGSHRFIK